MDSLIAEAELGITAADVEKAQETASLVAGQYAAVSLALNMVAYVNDDE